MIIGIQINICENMVNEKNDHGNDAEHYKFIGGYLVTNMVQCPMKHHVHHQVTLEFRYQSMILTLTFLKGLHWIELSEQLIRDRKHDYKSKIHGMERILENNYGLPANNWEIESRTTDRIWTLSWNMDREHWIYFKRDN
ncbi:WD repeat-containing protein 36, variant 5 [Dermatophagoides farinae]|uniref:WD repeat-containing protein 36, variant 5 n=1 Tax=Dermatophagoides farinae TaxID=6954 RepID=A0A922HRY5_DERFA|nr:WD repeat-containing protein 36, variant 5 [Dermatophagoides farinae]